MMDRTEWTVDAAKASQAWLNAAIASGQVDARPALYRTISVEFFSTGVQMVATDGHMLFRTWAGYSDMGDFPAAVPAWKERPVDSVVVMDPDKFALAFMKTLHSATSKEDAAPSDITFTIEPVVSEDEPPLGEELQSYVLVMAVPDLGQQLSCKLYEGDFPDWRALDLGVDPGERVDGLRVAPKILKAVGKLKGVLSVDLSFRGDDKAIDFRCDGAADVSGVLMPMRRPEEKKAEAQPEEQLEHGNGPALVTT